MKFFLLVALTIFGGLSAFAQHSARSKTVKKPARKTSIAGKIVSEKSFEREKFDPSRVAANDLQTAIAAAATENKRIILDVGGEWCGWCRLMDAFIAKNAELNQLKAENFVWLKINMSEENGNKEFLAKYPAISGYPHLFVLEKDGTLLKSKDTSELEDGKTYNTQKFIDFLNEYKPSKN